jgi:IclR family acetate operon transcriptional repressor/IclR family KDG regulon transcriptional repressor
MELTSLSKALGLLEATAGHADGRTLADLAAEVGMPKPTAHRILKTLTTLGYLERPSAGVYRQSMQANRLVSDEATRRLTDAACRPLRELHARCRETVNLGTLQHGRVVYLQVFECTWPLRRVADRTSDPFHTTALGRSIAAFLPPDRRQQLLSRARLERRTPATITDRATLVAELSRVVRQGYAIEIDETDIGVTCLGAPVFCGSEVAGAISVSVPTARAQPAARKQLLTLVQNTAHAITAALSKPRRPKGRRPTTPSR